MGSSMTPITRVICGQTMWHLIHSGHLHTGGTILPGAAGTGGITATQDFTIPGTGIAMVGIMTGIIPITGMDILIHTGLAVDTTIPTGEATGPEMATTIRRPGGMIHLVSLGFAIRRAPVRANPRVMK